MCWVCHLYLINDSTEGEIEAVDICDQDRAIVECSWKYDAQHKQVFADHAVSVIHRHIESFCDANYLYCICKPINLSWRKESFSCSCIAQNGLYAEISSTMCDRQSTAAYCNTITDSFGMWWPRLSYLFRADFLFVDQTAFSSKKCVSTTACSKRAANISSYLEQN